MEYQRSKWRISGVTYPAQQIIGKELIAEKNVNLYRYVGGPVIYVVAPGNPVGRPYSWIGGKDGKPLYWMFDDENGNVFYAKQEVDLFNFNALLEQGIKTTSELEAEKKAKEAENKGPLDTITDTAKSVTNLVKLGIGAYVGIQILRLFQNK